MNSSNHAQGEKYIVRPSIVNRQSSTVVYGRFVLSLNSSGRRLPMDTHIQKKQTPMHLRKLVLSLRRLRSNEFPQAPSDLAGKHISHLRSPDNHVRPSSCPPHSSNIQIPPRNYHRRYHPLFIPRIRYPRPPYHTQKTNRAPPS